MTDALHLPEVYLERISKELTTIRQLLGEALFAIRDAEREIPERIRRFTHHMHSMHDIKYMYEDLGIPVPNYIKHEIERLDDRFRQLIAEENAEGGSFSKVRREMATDPKNRYDHTRELAGPTHTKEGTNETRQSPSQSNGLDESRTDLLRSASSIPGSNGRDAGESLGLGGESSTEHPHVRR